MDKHPNGCDCDICTGAKSWTSTEEYLIYSAGASIPEPAQDETEEEYLERYMRETAEFHQRMGKAQAPHKHSEPCPICGGNHSRVICPDIL